MIDVGGLLFQESIHSRVFFFRKFPLFLPIHHLLSLVGCLGGVILVCHQSSVQQTSGAQTPPLLQLIRRIIGLTAVAMSTRISHRTPSLRHLLVCYLTINGAEQVELVQPL